MKFKVNNEVHEVEMDEAEGLAFLQARRPNATITPITDAEAAALLAPTPEEQLIIDQQIAKAAKQDALSKITVTTTAGNTFDGDEASRNNMMSALMAASFIGQTTTSWKLADNTIVTVTIPEITEALALSIEEAGRIILS